MTILLICSTDPADISAGGHQRTHLLHRALAGIGDVFTLVPVPLARLEKSDEQRHVRLRCIEQRFSPAWWADRYAQRHFPVVRVPCVPRGRIGHCWEGLHFDCVVTRYTTMAAATRAWREAPLFIDVDDLPEECYRTLYAKSGAGAFRRTGDRLATSLVAAWARSIRNRAAGVWFANGQHLAISGHANAGWLPNLPREPTVEPSAADHQTDYVMSVGLMWYVANQQGIGRFLRSVWPAIRCAHPALEYRIAGKGLPPSLRKAWEQIPGVRVMGFVDDLEALYRGALFTIAPVYSGSGTSIKVGESLRMGRVCITPRFGARGIDHLLGREDGLLIGDSDEQLLADSLWLLANPAARIALQARAAPRAREVFSFDTFAAAVRQVIDKGLGRP